MSDLHYYSVTQAAELIRTKKLSPVELTQAYLDRAQELDRELNAYMKLLPEPALTEAQRAQEEIAGGAYRGPLHGIPIAVKDLIDVAGVPTTAGSPILAGNVPRGDAPCIARLRAAGAIILGKTNLHEFAYGPTGINVHYGTPKNPWNRTRIPGGSSSGSGVAVASGLCAAALGSDTGGSIRIPASLCGIAGIKPTYGRVSKRGALPLAWSLDHVGPMARSVEDCGLVLQGLAGYDDQDPGSANVPVPDFTATVRQGVAGLRVGVVRDYFFENVDSQVLEAVEAAMAVLRSAGARLEDVSFPLARQSSLINAPIIQSEATAYHLPALRAHWNDFSPPVRLRLLSGIGATGAMYANAQRARAVMVRQALDLFQRVDVLLTPAEPVVAPLIEEAGKPDATVLAGERWEGIVNALTRFMRPFNMTGFPAMSVPCGFTAGSAESGLGLPIGLQLAGRPWDEATVLRAAYTYEQSTDWHTRRPIP